MRLRGLVLAVTAALAITACGSADDTGDGAGASATAPPADGSGADETVQEDTDPEAALVFAYHIGPSQGLDPHRSSQSHDITMLAPIYDRLLHEAPDGTLIPGLATDWSFTEDGHLDLTLRSGVTFHDGAAFDADVVVANLDRAKNVEGSAVAPLLALVDSVEVLDPLSIRIVTTGPAAILPRILADRPGMMVSPNSLDDPDLANNPVGSGMYRVVEYRPDDAVVYEPFEQYWDSDAVKLGRLEIRQIGDATARLNGLRSGDIDATWLDPNQADEAISAGLDVEAFTGTNFMFIQLNRTKSEFADSRVRQALNYAIDRAAIAEGLYFGYAEPTEQYFPEGLAGHVSALEGSYSYDPDRARTLLAEAGLADGFSFEVIVPSVPLRTAIAEAVQAQLAEIGVDMSISPVEPTQTGNVFYAQQMGDAMIADFPGRTDASMTGQIFVAPDAFTNPGGHTTDAWVQAYDASLSPLPDEERTPLLETLGRAMVEDPANVIMVSPQQIYATNGDVVGLKPYLHGKPEFRGVGVSLED